MFSRFQNPLRSISKRDNHSLRRTTKSSSNSCVSQKPRLSPHSASNSWLCSKTVSNSSKYYQSPNFCLRTSELGYLRSLHVTPTFQQFASTISSTTNSGLPEISVDDMVKRAKLWPARFHAVSRQSVGLSEPTWIDRRGLRADVHQLFFHNNLAPFLAGETRLSHYSYGIISGSIGSGKTRTGRQIMQLIQQDSTLIPDDIHLCQIEINVGNSMSKVGTTSAKDAIAVMMAASFWAGDASFATSLLQMESDLAPTFKKPQQYEGNNILEESTSSQPSLQMNPLETCVKAINSIEQLSIHPHANCWRDLDKVLKSIESQRPGDKKRTVLIVHIDDYQHYSEFTTEMLQCLTQTSTQKDRTIHIVPILTGYSPFSVMTNNPVSCQPFLIDLHPLSEEESEMMFYQYSAILRHIDSGAAVMRTKYHHKKFHRALLHYVSGHPGLLERYASTLLDHEIDTLEESHEVIKSLCRQLDDLYESSMEKAGFVAREQLHLVAEIYFQTTTEQTKKFSQAYQMGDGTTFHGRTLSEVCSLGLFNIYPKERGSHHHYQLHWPTFMYFWMGPKLPIPLFEIPFVNLLLTFDEHSFHQLVLNMHKNTFILWSGTQRSAKITADIAYNHALQCPVNSPLLSNEISVSANVSIKHMVLEDDSKFDPKNVPVEPVYYDLLEAETAPVASEIIDATSNDYLILMGDSEDGTDSYTPMAREVYMWMNCYMSGAKLKSQEYYKEQALLREKLKQELESFEAPYVPNVHLESARHVEYDVHWDDNTPINLEMVKQLCSRNSTPELPLVLISPKPCDITQDVIERAHMNFGLICGSSAVSKFFRGLLPTSALEPVPVFQEKGESLKQAITRKHKSAGAAKRHPQIEIPRYNNNKKKMGMRY